MGATNPRPDETEWLTVKEIADELRLTSATVRTWIAGGTLRAKRAGKRKWLVQRGELNRMLAGQDRLDAARRDGEPQWHRAPDGVLPPQQSPDWPPPGMPERLQDISPTRWMGLTSRFWWDYLEESEFPPPDADLPVRMKRIARSMAAKAAAIANLDGADPGALWHLQDGLPNGVLSRELSPQANRPGSAALWSTFDASVAALDQAMRAADLGAERVALEAVALAMHDVIEELEEMGYPWPQLTSFARGTLAPDGQGVDRPLSPDGRALHAPEGARHEVDADAGL